MEIRVWDTVKKRMFYDPPPIPLFEEEKTGHFLLDLVMPRFIVMKLLPDLKCFEGDLLEFENIDGIYVIWCVLGDKNVCEITRFDKKDIPKRIERKRLADMLRIERADGTYFDLFRVVGDAYEHPVTVIDLINY